MIDTTDSTFQARSGAFASALDAQLQSIGNGPDAVRRLLEALDRFPASDEPRPTAEPEFTPAIEDWADYEAYLDRIDTIKRLHDEDERLDRETTLARLHREA